MGSFKAPELPVNHIEFAKDIASAAKKYGIEKFNVKYTPIFDLENPELTFWGELSITYSSVDNRGRPETNLKVSFKTDLKYDIVKTQQS